MSLEYQGVQGGHAAVQWVLDNIKTQTWNNGTIVYLVAKDLDHWMSKLDRKDISYSKFVEPDVGNIVTAIATLGNGRLFKNLQLMGAV